MVKLQHRTLLDLEISCHWTKRDSSGVKGLALHIANPGLNAMGLKGLCMGLKGLCNPELVCRQYVGFPHTENIPVFGIISLVQKGHFSSPYLLPFIVALDKFLFDFGGYFFGRVT